MFIGKVVFDKILLKLINQLFDLNCLRQLYNIKYYYLITL